MWGIARGLLCLLLSASLWQAACAEPWAMAEPADPPPTATFVPSVFSEFGADGYWAWGSVVQGTNPSAGALIHFDADGQQQARAFDKVVINNLANPNVFTTSKLLKRLADGGVLMAGSRGNFLPPDALPSCVVTRVTADGRKQWQSELDGGACFGVDIDAAGEIWVAMGIFPRFGISQVLRLRDDGSIATRVVLDDPLLTLVEMQVDPAGAGVFMAGHRTEANNPQAARAHVQRLRADGSVDWSWQLSTTATASSVKHLRVSASTGIFAISTLAMPYASGVQEKDWQASGLSLAGVPRFDNKISFSNAVDVVGASAPDAAGEWLVLQSGSLGDGENNATLSVVRLSATGTLGNSNQISGATGCLPGSACKLALRRDGGLWLMVVDQNPTLVGIDAHGNERARWGVFSQQALNLLPDDRALVITGTDLLGPTGAVRVSFGQPAEPWSQLNLSGRALAPLEAVASDGAIAQWWNVLPGLDNNTAISSLTFRTSDTAPVAWRVEFPLFGKIQLSVSPSMVCMAGYLRDIDSLRHVLECRRRADGSLLWSETRPASSTQVIDRFEAITALEDGRAVAISSGLGSLSQWVIGGDGQILAQQSRPLLGVDQQPLGLNRVTFNAQGDALLTGFDQTDRSRRLLRLDHDGVERFQTAFSGAVAVDGMAFTHDGGAVVYGSVIARYLPTGEKLWEITPARPIAELVADSDTIVFSMHSEISLFPVGWEVVALDSANGSERWRLLLDAPPDESAGIATLVGGRLAVLQTEDNHLRYRELVLATGELLREQTDDCGGEECGCELGGCVPRVARGLIDALVEPRPALPLQVFGGRLRTRLGNLKTAAGWGSSVLHLADAGQNIPTVRADQAGVGGVWFAPWSSGQGLMLDWIADARTLFGNWLTFTPDGGNDPSGLRWYTLQGVLADASRDATLAILSNEGGSFGVGVTVARRVGTAQLRFESCDFAQFSYQFDPDVNDGLSGVVTLSRLVPGATCSGSLAGAPTTGTTNALDSGVDGAWFDPVSSGQGLMFSAFPAQDTQFATWFTYDTETAPGDSSRQHWFTLQGPLGSAEEATLAIIRTTGGALMSQRTGNSQQVGTARVTRLGCDRMQLDYQFDDSEIAGPFRRISGSQQLQRIARCAD